MTQQPQNQTSLENKRNNFQISSIIGLSLIGLGVLILAAELFHFSVGRYLWPFFIFIPGVSLLTLSHPKYRDYGVPFVVIGSILTMLGLLFFYQTITNHWVSWAYAWALVSPTSFGLGLWWLGVQQNRENLIHSGKILARIGIILFLAGAVFFEVILGLSEYGRALTPLLLIGAGIYLLYQSIKK